MEKLTLAELAEAHNRTFETNYDEKNIWMFISPYYEADNFEPFSKIGRFIFDFSELGLDGYWQTNAMFYDPTQYRNYKYVKHFYKVEKKTRMIEEVYYE